MKKTQQLLHKNGAGKYLALELSLPIQNFPTGYVRSAISKREGDLISPILKIRQGLLRNWNVETQNSWKNRTENGNWKIPESTIRGSEFRIPEKWSNISFYPIWILKLLQIKIICHEPMVISNSCSQKVTR